MPPTKKKSNPASQIAAGKPSTKPASVKKSSPKASVAKNEAKSPAKTATGKSSPAKPATAKPTAGKPSNGKPVAGKIPAGKAPAVKSTAQKNAGAKVAPTQKTASAKSPTIKTTPKKSTAATKTASKPIPAAPTKKPTKIAPQKTSTPAKSLSTEKASTPKTLPTPKTNVLTKSAIKATIAPAPAPTPKLPTPPKTNTDPKIVEKIRSAHAEKEQRKDLAQTPPKRTLTPITSIPAVVKGEDRIILMVRDPYWIHAHWDISRQAVERAKAALADHWHSVKPVLRLLKFEDNGTTESSENVHREIEIHGGVRNWYIDVDTPPARFQILMGYRTSQNRFYELVRSNTVTTPAPSGKGALDDHWADIAKDAEKIYAMSGGYGDDTQKGDLAEVFEDRLKRTMDLDVMSQFGSGAEGGLRKPRQFHFDVEAELVVFGSTHPDAHVAIGSDPVKVKPDGTFSIRLPFPDRRQVLPATARSRDGIDEQTVVIAVERNTKVMEPLSMEGDDL